MIDLDLINGNVNFVSYVCLYGKMLKHWISQKLFKAKAYYLEYMVYYMTR